MLAGLPRSSVWASPRTAGGARASTVSAAQALPPSSPRASSAWPPPNDEDMMEQVGNAVGVEARSSNMYAAPTATATFSKGLTVWAPNINIFRDPRWGHGLKLTARIRSDGPPRRPSHLRVCRATIPITCRPPPAPAFRRTSGPEADRHRCRHRLQAGPVETYLPAFPLVKEAGVEAVMGAYSRTNGEPCCGSRPC